MRPDEHRHVGRHLVVARARGVQLPAHGAGDLGHPPFDRHVDVLVVLGERERAVTELALHLIERVVKLVAVLLGDDPLRREHRGMRARLLDVIRAKPPVEADRIVQAPEGGVLRLGEA